MKICKTCNNEKENSNYYSDKKLPGGLGHECKTCVKDRSRTKEAVIRAMYAHQRDSSKKRNHPMPSYTKEELVLALMDMPLYHKLYENWVNSDYHKELKPSIDRLDNYLPYTESNIQLITFAENRQEQHRHRKEGIDTRGCQEVVAYSNENTIIKEYYSIAQAGRELEIEASNIRNALKRGCRSAGFYWKYKHKEF